MIGSWFPQSPSTTGAWAWEVVAAEERGVPAGGAPLPLRPPAPRSGGSRG